MAGGEKVMKKKILFALGIGIVVIAGADDSETGQRDGHIG